MLMMLSHGSSPCDSWTVPKSDQVTDLMVNLRLPSFVHQLTSCSQINRCDVLVQLRKLPGVSSHGAFWQVDEQNYVGELMTIV